MAVPYLSVEYPLRFAHRGSRLLWPENTAEAFQGAVDLGYRYIETDVGITRDGVVVAFHDETLERTTNGVGPVSQWDFADLQRLDAAWWFDPGNGYPLRGTGVRVRSLDEVFASWPDVHFNLDMKSPNLEWPVADVIKRHSRESSTLIGSFVDYRVFRFRRITRGEIAVAAGPLSVLAMVGASRIGKTIRRPVQAYQLPFNYELVPIDSKLVTAIHAAGAQLHTWTVNEAADMNRLLDLGVDGIVTDRPDTLNEVLRERGHDV
ncbi:MAG: glycerophosphodiester phosphodiesterase [Acidimicrobiia bacterium]|nr:glycerophosphodiester phosphodiesterase [Acidimicrobiia bacterium]